LSHNGISNTPRPGGNETWYECSLDCPLKSVCLCCGSERHTINMRPKDVKSIETSSV